MQIVIDIPDNMQEMCRWHKDCICNLTSLEVDILAEAVRNGTVLPKGHGRLIDADKALDYFTTNMNWVDEDDNRIDNSDERKAIFKDYFDGVPTSIEADKEVKE